MKRALVLAVLVFLLLPSVGSPKVSEGSPSTTPAFPFGSIVAFVDNEIVDLMWDDVPGNQGYKLYRGDSTTGESLPVEWIGEKRFSRVIAVSSGADTKYQVCAVLANLSEDCSSRESVSHARVKGTLHKNRTWSSDLFELDGVVEVMEKVTLTINNLATVDRRVSPSAYPAIIIEPGGRLMIGGGGPPPTIKDISIDYNSIEYGLSKISGEEGSLVELEGVHIYLSQALEIQFCELKSGSKITVNSASSAIASNLSHNIFDSSHIELRGGKADIAFNQFKGYPISAIDVAGSEATIEKNDFKLELGASGIRVWPDTGGQVVTIRNNTFQRQNPAHRPEMALWLWRDVKASTDPPAGLGSPTVVIESNLIRDFGTGANIGSDINVDMRMNTLTGNGAGINDDSGGSLERVTINDNCIVRNGVGVFGTAGLDVTGNWWGSSSGPRTDASNPGDKGDFVFGGADFKGWLKKDNCDPRVRNLRVLDIEVVQVTQKSDHSVPLVEGKEAVVRVYLESVTGETVPISGKLTVRRGSEPLGTRSSSSGGKAIYPNNYGLLRTKEENSIMFKLPKEWAAGTISLTADINTNEAFEENDYGDNDKTVVRTFMKKLPLRTGLVPVRPSGKQLQAGAALDLESLLQMGELFRKIYPSHEVEYSILPTIDWPYEMVEPAGHTDYGKYEALLFSTLGVSHMRLQAEGGWAGQTIDQVYAAFPEDATSYHSSDPTSDGGRGIAGFGPSYWSDFNQSLANNLGLVIDYIASSGYDAIGVDCPTTGEVGYDVVADRFMPADSAHFYKIDWEICPESTPRWIGPGAYQRLFDYNDSMALLQKVAPPAEGPQIYVLISGVVERDPVIWNKRTVEFLPVWQVTAAAPPLNPPVGTHYCLELQDAAGTVLESYYFDAEIPTGWRSFRGFQVALPLTGTPARIVLVRGEELGSIPVSASPPVVNIDSGQVQATSASLPISWSGSDSDGDSLFYSVQYSADDQATWLPAASNITETTYTLNLGEVPGGTQAWVRVQASDGFHTTSDLQGPFVVEDHGPLVSISSPESLGLISADPTLSGYAYDMEDGELEGSSLVWTSSVDGPLGTGRLVYATGLTTGTHTLTLVATDSQGRSASDAVTVFVNCARDINAVFLPLVRR